MQVPRCLRASAPALFVLFALAHSACYLPVGDPSRYYLVAPLVPIGGALGSGRVEVLLDANTRVAFFAVEGLAPDADYSVTLAGAPLATLLTDSAGRTQLLYSITSRSDDPRGRRIAVVDPAGTEVLELAGPEHRDFREAEVATLGAFAPGSSVAMSVTLGDARHVVTSLHGAEPGTYDVLVDGDMRARLDAPAGHAIAAFVADVAPNATVELQRDGVGYYAGSLRANIEGIDWCGNADAAQALEAMGAGIGRARLVTRPDCSRRFEVAVAWVPQGDYQVWVGGVLRGSLVVGEDENGVTQGSLVLASNEPIARLDFDPIGEPIAVEQDGLPYFSLSHFNP